MRELSSNKDNVRVIDGKTYLIRWNPQTRAWHIRKYSTDPNAFMPIRGTILTTPRFPLLLIKQWEYDPAHEERLNFSKLPLITSETCNNFHGALRRFAHYVNDSHK